MYPPTISFASTNGPSETPVVVTTLPPGFSFAPMSAISALNFSFHALNAAYISCICAGEGDVPFCPGALRWITRYLRVGIGNLLWSPPHRQAADRRVSRSELDTTSRV